MTVKDPALARAERHVKVVRDFFYHLMVYVFVGVLLVIVDLAGGANDGFLGLDFAFWVLLPWGLGVLGHAVYAFFGERRVTKMYLEERERESMSR